MSAILLPLGATAAAAGLTYWFCIRPMRRGAGCSPASSHGAADAATDIDAQVTAARAELDQLRAARDSAPRA